jgi:hypothetical protein
VTPCHAEEGVKNSWLLYFQNLSVGLILVTYENQKIASTTFFQKNVGYIDVLFPFQKWNAVSGKSVKHPK